jgi:hypothetical protein
MPGVSIDRGDFWEFKARCAELDLAIAKQRALLDALASRRNAVVDAFAARHGFDPARPLVLDDEALTAAQAEAPGV